jgi:hypothetical protein
MAKPKEVIHKHLEVKSYEHLGICVKVSIDYDKEKISLLGPNGGPKQWVFAGRELEYMQGWQNILDAMKFAISAAEADLRKHVDVVEKKKIAFMREVQKESADW